MQIFCPNCRGGNSPADSTCRWCGFSLDQGQQPYPQSHPPNKAPAAPGRSGTSLQRLRQWVDSERVPEPVRPYLRAITAPYPITYETELPNASWAKVLLAVAIAAGGALVQYLILVGAARADLDRLTQMLTAMGVDAAPFITLYDLVLAGGPIRAFVTPFITFPAGALFLMLMAKLFGGRGRSSNFLENVKQHCYLLSLVYAPLRLLILILAVIPLIGVGLGVLVFLYQVFCTGVTLQVSQGISSGKAQLAVFLPQIALFILSFIVSFALIMFVFIETVQRLLLLR
jgi:hypothetical protein